MSVPDPLSGLLVIDKPRGITSHDVVARARRALDTRKVGHAGTLDPMATGVLVLGVGRATRLLGHLMLTDKAYDATVRLGATTTTDDADGEIVATRDASGIGVLEVREAARAFVGELQQVPSSVSAIKVDGRRAYARVRAGESVELAARAVTVHELTVHDVVLADVLSTGVASTDVRISVRCSSGTYVRAIARDLGVALGVGGHLTALRRTAVGPFDLTGTHTLDDLATRGRAAVHPIAAAVRATFPTLLLDDESSADVRVGRPLALDLATSGPVALFTPAGEFLALYEQRGDRAVARAVFV